MTQALRKICGLITAGLIAVSSSAQGDLAAITNDWYQWYQNCYSSSQEYIPCGKAWVGGDLLWWRAVEDGLGCQPIDIHERWHAGYRVGVGYYHLNSDWALDAYWTSFHAKTSGHQQGCHEEKNDAHWKLDFDVVDAQYSLKFCQSPWFTWRPFGGVRFARIEQKLRTNTHKKHSNRLTDYQKLCAFGPEIGIAADYEMACGFSFYGNASAALVYGTFHMHCDDCKQNRQTTCQTALDLGLGIRTKVCAGCFSPTLQLGWEHHRYFDYNHIGCTSDLCLDGAVFSACIDF